MKKTPEKHLKPPQPQTQCWPGHGRLDHVISTWDANTEAGCRELCAQANADAEAEEEGEGEGEGKRCFAFDYSAKYTSGSCRLLNHVDADGVQVLTHAHTHSHAHTPPPPPPHTNCV